MARTGGHKALVPVSAEEWRAFRALCMVSDTTIGESLASLVRQTLGRAGVELPAPATPIAGQLELRPERPVRGRRTPAGGQLAASAGKKPPRRRRAASGAPAASRKAKPKG